MKTTKKEESVGLGISSAELVDYLSKECWKYIKTVTDIVREPILILDKNLNVMSANESFYRMFQVEMKDTEGKLVYNLGNGQWNIPSLRKLLEEILPKNTFFKNFEVTHEFPFIGKKVMILNARQIHTVDNGNPPLLPPIIFLAIEDITAMMVVAETLAVHIKELASKNAERAQGLENQIGKLQREINQLKSR